MFLSTGVHLFSSYVLNLSLFCTSASIYTEGTICYVYYEITNYTILGINLGFIKFNGCWLSIELVPFVKILPKGSLCYFTRQKLIF